MDEERLPVRKAGEVREGSRDASVGRPGLPGVRRPGNSGGSLALVCGVCEAECHARRLRDRLPAEDSRMAGRKVTTAIFKEPVEGRVRIRRTGLVGDRQADPSVHAGPTKAVYAYPSEHYPFWRRELGQADLPWGSFGENLTTEGLDERTLRVGDRLRVGSALLEVTQPRMPCYKLGVRFGRLDMVRRFLPGGRSGLFLPVHEEGDVAASDPIEPLRAAHARPRRVPGVEPG